MRTTEIAKLLAKDAEGLCKELYPHLKNNIHGGEFELGDVGGSSGKSMKVRLKGAKAGAWIDFNGEEKGDLIGLIMAVKKCGVIEARKYACDRLGIDDVYEDNLLSHNKSSKSYPRAAMPQKNTASKDVREYLLQQRKLLPETIKAFKVYGEGNDIKFPFIVGDECYFIKRRSIINKKDTNVDPESAEHCLFGWQTFDGTERIAAFTEGELDAMSLYQYGYKALSIPLGAKCDKWIDIDYERLKVFDMFYIVMDMDKSGQEAAQRIVKRLGEERCRIVKFPIKDGKQIKDANECLQLGITKEEIDQCFNNAEYQDPEELKPFSAFMDEAYLILHPELAPDVGVKLEVSNGNIVFRPDEVSLWSGINGHGKSLFLGQVMLDSMKQGARVCIASLEVRPARTLSRLLRQLGRSKEPSDEDHHAAGKWLDDRLWIFDFLGETNHKKLLKIFEYAYKRYGIETFLIDSMMMLDIHEDKLDPQRKFIQKVCAFARKFNVHVHLVAHPRKQKAETDIPGKLDVSGSGMLTNAVENVFVFWRNKLKEDILSRHDAGDTEVTFDEIERARKSPDCSLICAKNRNGDWEGKIHLAFHKDSMQYLNSRYDNPKIYIDPKEIKLWYEDE